MNENINPDSDPNFGPAEIAFQQSLIAGGQLERNALQPENGLGPMLEQLQGESPPEFTYAAADGRVLGPKEMSDEFQKGVEENLQEKGVHTLLDVAQSNPDAYQALSASVGEIDPATIKVSYSETNHLDPSKPVKRVTFTGRASNLDSAQFGETFSTSLSVDSEGRTVVSRTVNRRGLNNNVSPDTASVYDSSTKESQEDSAA